MFSNESRWDRHRPEIVRNEDLIDVGVIFRKGKAYPKSFIWEDRKYLINEVTYHWAEKRGADLLHYYTVTDGANVYQIYLNTKTLEWRLKEVCPAE